MCCRLVIFLSLLATGYCCFGRGNKVEEPDVEADESDSEHVPDPWTDNVNSDFVGWGPDHPKWAGVGWGRPPGASSNWGYGGKDPLEPGPGDPGYVRPPRLDPMVENSLPENWRGMGVGSGGASPPPWAYQPSNVGKPSYCFLPPVKGPCKKKLTRYGFNPFANTCQAFPYGGCGGNENNFVSKKRCDEECGALPGPDCAPLDDPTDEIEELEAFYT